MMTAAKFTMAFGTFGRTSRDYMRDFRTLGKIRPSFTEHIPMG